MTKTLRPSSCPPSSNCPGLSEAHSYLRFDQQGAHAVQEGLAREEEVVISYGGKHQLYGTCTPIDLLDYAVGMSFDNEIISRIDQIHSLVCDYIDGRWLIEVGLEHDVNLDERFADLAQRNASPLFVGDVGLDQPLCAPYQLKVTSPKRLSPSLIWKASKDFQPLQTLNSACGSTHAAAFVTWDNEFLFVREDVARHSALVKLIGACLRAGVSPHDGFIFLSSRCAVELAIKIARFGVSLVATVSAPTMTTVAFAHQVGLTICSYARDQRFTAYTHPECFEIPGETTPQ